MCAGAAPPPLEESQGVDMILEHAVLNVRLGQSAEFEQAFLQAQRIIGASPGYLGHELRRCLENPNQYLLLVGWRTLEDHTIGFRQSAPYQEWRRLLHRFYDPFPVVEHYEAVAGCCPLALRDS
jgi:heme-degrading monooxygenase HmoA